VDAGSNPAASTIIIPHVKSTIGTHPGVARACVFLAGEAREREFPRRLTPIHSPE